MPPPDMELEEGKKTRTRIRRVRPLPDEEHEAQDLDVEDEQDPYGEDIDDFDLQEGDLPAPVEGPAEDKDPPEEFQSPRVSLAKENREARKTKTSPARSAVAERVSEDFSDILEEFNFGVDAHTIYVERLEPQYDPHNPARRIAGHCGKYTRLIDIEEIRKVHGGGRYAIVVRGPNENTGRGTVIKARRVVEIEGAPIPLVDPREEARQQQREEGKRDELVKTLMDQQTQRTQQLEKEARELQAKLQEQQMNMFETITKLNENKTDPMAAMSPVLEALREDARRRDEQAREDRRREEIRAREEKERQEVARKEEREEQRRRDEEARRSHEKELELQRQQFEKQMKQLEMQMEMQREQVRAEAQAQQQNMNMMLQFMTKTDSEKEARSKEMSQLQMTMFQSMAEMQRSSADQQISLLKEQAGKNNLVETIGTLSQIKEFLSPSETDERETWEKVMDRVGEMAPGVVAGLGAMRTQGAQGAQQPQVPGAGPRPVLAPGTVAVVDDIDRMQAALNPSDYPQEEVWGQEPEQVQVESKPAASPPKQPQQPQQPQQNAAPAEETPPESVNTLTEFPPEYMDEGNNEKALTELVCRIDLAVQRNLDSDELYANCVEPLPDRAKSFLKMLPAETLQQFIEQNVPESWAIRSLAGEQAVADAHERLRTSA